MPTSSGQLAGTHAEYVSCPACDWFGRCDVDTDPEINLWAFTCPECTQEHREELR